MRNRIYYILSLLIVILIFSGCKKYPEDNNFITFHSVQKRLLGDWKIIDFKINDISSINLFDSTINERKVKIDKSIPEDNVDGDIVILADVYGIWLYENNQEQLKFQFYEQVNNNTFFYFGPFVSATTSIWDIRKLTMEELWLETDYENKSYKLFLIKQ